MAVCKDCNKVFNGDIREYFCPKCNEKHERRNELSKAIDVLKRYADKEDYELSQLGITGFSWYQLEVMAITLKRFAKAMSLPSRKRDFVSEGHKEDAKKFFQDNDLNPMEIEAINKTKNALVYLNEKVREQGNSDWRNATTSDVICFMSGTTTDYFRERYNIDPWKLEEVE